MFSKKIRQSKPNSFSCKHLLFASALTLSLVSKSNVISQPFINSNQEQESQYSNRSFITKAIEKTGPSVVTIDVQKFVRQKKFPRNSTVLIDPYFEKFFGLKLPYENQPQIEESQGTGFIFGDGLIMTNAHVINGSETLIVGLSNGSEVLLRVIYPISIAGPLPSTIFPS